MEHWPRIGQGSEGIGWPVSGWPSERHQLNPALKASPPSPVTVSGRLSSVSHRPVGILFDGTYLSGEGARGLTAC